MLDLLEAKIFPAITSYYAENATKKPLTLTPRIMWDWLIAHKATFYKTYFVEEGWREYEFVYKRSVDEELSHIAEQSPTQDLDRFKEILKAVVSRSTTHWGQYTPNKATIAGTVRMALLQYADECGVRLPEARAKTLTPKEYLT